MVTRALYQGALRVFFTKKMKKLSPRAPLFKLQLLVLSRPLEKVCKSSHTFFSSAPSPPSITRLGNHTGGWFPFWISLPETGGIPLIHNIGYFSHWRQVGKTILKPWIYHQIDYPYNMYVHYTWYLQIRRIEYAMGQL